MTDQCVQLKLSNGDEIVCEVIDWNIEDQFKSILIRHVFKITFNEDTNLGVRYYTLRPWMTYIDEPNKNMLLSTASVVGQSKLTGRLLNEYKNTVSMAYKTDEEIQQENHKLQKSRDEMYNALRYQLLQLYGSDSTNEDFPVPDATIH